MDGLGSQLLAGALLTGNQNRITIGAGLVDQRVEALHLGRDADHSILGWLGRLVRFRAHGLNRS
jgi:hypothetical protein